MSNSNVTYMCAPDQSLRELIGKNVDLNTVFSADVIKSCQELVLAAQETFFPKAQLEITDIKHLYQTIVMGENVGHILHNIRDRVLIYKALHLFLVMIWYGKYVPA